MSTRAWAVLALAAAPLLAACGTTAKVSPVEDEARRADMARVLSQTAIRAAVAIPGATVCREVTIGISERTWVRGTVVEARADRLRIKVTDPGRFPDPIAGARVERGALIWDEALRWRPCS